MKAKIKKREFEVVEGNNCVERVKEGDDCLDWEVSDFF